MDKIRVTKEFGFEMSHALLNYDGACKHIHGHSYKLFVTVFGSPLQDETNPKLGMLIDFGDLKRLVNTEIVDVYDHAFLLNSKVKDASLSSDHEMYEKTFYVDYQPTCENLVIDFAHKLKNKLPEGIELFSLRLYETATSYAEWFASDNASK